MRASILVLLAACSSTDDGMCPPVACNSCELGYYADRIPTGATRVRVDSSANATATVWFIVGDPNAGTSTTIGKATATSPLPITLPIPAGTERITAVTGGAPLLVAFDRCD